ncbi:MAG TPA: hypothetical protein VFK14_10940 [Solirubrobacterales bacterium]|nr:hypothetical protein [Solirubrobacterales bacterium]
MPDTVWNRRRLIRARQHHNLASVQLHRAWQMRLAALEMRLRARERRDAQRG